MELFYTNHIKDNTAFFEEEEARHIAKAFRKRQGDTLYFTDGQGVMYSSAITSIDRKGIQVDIIERKPQKKAWKGQLTMALSPTKNFNRIEWVVERMVELGVDVIQLLETDNSERRKWKLDRLERIMISAIKQSQKFQLPRLIEPQSFYSYCESYDHETRFYIGHCEKGEKIALRDIQMDAQNVGFCVGPEGDFSPKEIECALAHGMTAVSLGNSRLRTETAAFKMATAFQIQNDIE